MPLWPLFRTWIRPHALRSHHQRCFLFSSCSLLHASLTSVHAAATAGFEPTHRHTGLLLPHRIRYATDCPAPIHHSLHRHPFARLGVADAIVERLLNKEIHYPTDIQAAAIPLINNAESCALQSFTGSGKTLAYLLPILSKLSFASDGKHSPPFSALVVAPSHELCMQIVREAHDLLPDHQDQVQQAICGANIGRQIKSLSKYKPSLVVGTPPRIAALIHRGYLLAYKRQLLVMDEVRSGQIACVPVIAVITQTGVRIMEALFAVCSHRSIYTALPQTPKPPAAQHKVLMMASQFMACIHLYDMPAHA
jgi:hypothetical protein